MALKFDIEDVDHIVSHSCEIKNTVIASMPNPSVSVLLVSYNHKDYIVECIESVLCQKTSFQFEIIIGEDNSTDGTREIVLDYAKKYPDRIRVITSDNNVGEKKNKIRCLKNCRGKYIAPCDSDDYWDDESKLQKQFEFMESNPDYSMCYHRFVFFQDGKQIETNEFEFIDRTAEELKRMPPGIIMCTKFFRNVYIGADNLTFSLFNNDYPINSFMGNFGACKYLGDIKPSIYRLHDNNNIAGRPLDARFHEICRVRTVLYYYYYYIKNDHATAIHVLLPLKINMENIENAMYGKRNRTYCKILQIKHDSIVINLKFIKLKISLV